MKTRDIAALAAAAVIGSGLLIPVSVAQAAPPKSCSDTMREDIPKGDPDYAPRLDRNKDGFACDSSDRGSGGSVSSSSTATRTSTAKPTKSSTSSTTSTARSSSGGLAKTGV